MFWWNRPNPSQVPIVVDLKDVKISQMTNLPPKAKIGKEDKVLTLEPHLAVFEGYAQIDNSEMKNKFAYASNGEAFDAAVKALKNILIEQGYQEKNGGFEK